MQKFAKSLFGDGGADVDRILRPLTAAQNALRLQIGRLEDGRDDQMAKTVAEIQAETSLMRANMVTKFNELNETNKTYASFIEAQNAEIKSLHAENRALRLVTSKLDALNNMHQIVDEVLRTRDFNAKGKHRAPSTRSCVPGRPLQIPLLPFGHLGIRDDGTQPLTLSSYTIPTYQRATPNHIRRACGIYPRRAGHDPMPQI